MENIFVKISQQFSMGQFEFTYPYMSDNIRWHLVGATVLSTKQSVIEHCDKMAIEIANSTCAITNYIAENSQVAVQGDCKYKKDDGSNGKVMFCDIYRFNNEKLAEITSYLIEENK